MFYTSIKKINRLRKEIDRLLMSNVYLKVTIEKSWESQNLDSQNLKNFSHGHRILKLLVTT